MKRIAGIILSTAAVLLLWGCAESDKEFVHDSCTISQLICTARHASTDVSGDIYEYDANNNEIKGSFTPKEVEGGYGLIIFRVPQSQAEATPLDNVFLKATLSWDQFVTPSFSGKHDITGEGKFFTVTSGTGTTRKYRVRGEYE